MPHSILALKPILSNEIIVRYMAVQACCISMTALLPGSILRCHDMAIHTNFRSLGNIRIGPGDIDDCQTKPKKCAQSHGHRNPPFKRRSNQKPKLIYLISKQTQKPFHNKPPLPMAKNL